MKKPLRNSSTPPKSLKLLFADDERSLQDLMRIELARMGHEVTVCPDGLAAIAALETTSFDCLLVDLDMPGAGGIDVIARCKELSPDTECVVLTGKSSLPTAIAALKHGVFDYLNKPCRLMDLETLLARVAARRELTHQLRALRRRLDSVEGAPRLVGASAAMERVRERIAKVAGATSTVLILGETGTGKELVARSLHEQSPRSGQPYIAVNCGALPEALIESELFGHRKGAFTGADENRAGLFEVASGGSIFLDEIGELPKPLQPKLLRVLESGEIRRLGDNQSLRVDVRVICATHRNLEQMVEEGSFREDLMFRINTFEIHLPALRDRIEDVGELARHLIRRLRPTVKENDELLSPEALELLQAHAWPGNVRELANVIEHAAILCDRLPITAEHLPERLTQRKLRLARPPRLGPVSLRDLEWQAIQEALQRNDGNKPKAAEELGISLKTLYNRLSQDQPLERTA